MTGGQIMCVVIMTMANPAASDSHITGHGVTVTSTASPTTPEHSMNISGHCVHDRSTLSGLGVSN